VAGYTECRDTYLDSANPTYNFGGDLYNDVRNNPKMNFVISFGLPPEVLGKTIVQARILFYCWYVSGWQAGRYLDLYRVTEAWEEGTADGSYQPGCASWTVKNGGAGGDVAWSVPGGTHAPELLDRSLIPNNAYYPEFDITGLVQEWANGGIENLGVVLKNDTPIVTGIKASEYSEYGRPYLEITYALPTGLGPVAGSACGLELLPNCPNPARPATTLQFRVAEACRLQLCVFALDGRKVATLLDGPVTTGFHQIIWRGEDDRGTALPSGIYFARLRSDAADLTRKILLTK
jgi:hypothetical protein